MRRIEIVRGVNELTEALKSSKLPDAIRGFLRIPSKVDIPPLVMTLLFQGFKDFAIKAHGLSPAAREIARILNLERLENPEIWHEALLSDERRHVLFTIQQEIAFALKHLPEIASLFQQEPFKLIGQSGEIGVGKDKSILSVVVIEDGDRYSSPSRLIDVLQSVESLYRACAFMKGIPPEGLSVIALDSGSDKALELFRYS